jgi:hypothetical protein
MIDVKLALTIFVGTLPILVLVIWKAVIAGKGGRK